jgi:BirA family transcriptional regulator, biotin operon repressor / biotin---[acetyl-CoA-carboxylase] ligase
VEDDLSEEAIRAHLRGRWAGTPLRVYAVTGSTNEHALAWADEGAPEGAVVVAGHQTKGRGRRGRTWWSEPGSSLLFSVLLRPNRPAVELGLLTTAVGIACARAIEESTGVNVSLKWPNDLVVRDRKVGGILVETRVTELLAVVAVAGIGINLADLLEAPAEVFERSTNIAAEMRLIGKLEPPSRAQLLGSILASLDDLYPALEGREILDEAARRSATIGRRVRIERADGSLIEGRAVGLASTGGLEVEGEGDRIAVDSGVVTAVEALPR